MAGAFWVETLGCPKNQVDSEKLIGTLHLQGMTPAGRVEDADLVVVNTCAFIEAARAESIESILDIDSARASGSSLVVTGCMAERYGDELADALPEVDHVVGFGQPVALGRKGDNARSAGKLVDVAAFDLLNLPRPPARAPWAYVKIAEGCDRRCGFCAIPSFRGPQRSRSVEQILAEVDSLGVAEVVLVAQDLASYGRDKSTGGRSQAKALVPLVKAVSERVARTRLLYLYPSELDAELIEAIGNSECAYFDLSLQHVSRRLLSAMRRWGDGTRFLNRVADIRRQYPQAAFRSSFIVGYPGETDADHDQLVEFIEAAQLDWAAFFPYSLEDGTYGAGLGDQVPPELMLERLRECGEIQDRITAARRDALVGSVARVLVDRPGVGRSHREAPEIDGVIRVPADLAVGGMFDVVVTSAIGIDLVADSVGPLGRVGGTEGEYSPNLAVPVGG